MFPKTADIVFVRPLANWLWNMHILHKSCSSHSWVNREMNFFFCDKPNIVQYKTRLSKQEARSFHRTALQFPSNVEIRFGKVRTAKKKKDKSGRKLGKGGNVGEGLHKTGDLSLRDTSNFVLWEYSEEHPPIISNFGMGSVLVNYYRKKDEKDDHMPRVCFFSSMSFGKLKFRKRVNSAFHSC